MAALPVSYSAPGPLSDSPAPPLPLGSRNADIAGQVATVQANGGYLESNDSFHIFRFIGGRLTLVGSVTDLTLVEPTHDRTGLAPAVVPTPPIVNPTQLTQLAGDPQIPTTTPQQIRTQLTQLDASLAAARSTDASSAYTLSLEAQDAALRAALSQVQLAPSNYGGRAELLGLLGNVLR